MAEIENQLSSALDGYVSVAFAFVWLQPERRPILVKDLKRDGYRLISLLGDDDQGIDGKKGSPAVFDAGLAKAGTTMKFEWEVRLLDEIEAMEAHVRVGDAWTKLRTMESPGFDKTWKDTKTLTVPHGADGDPE